MKQPLVTIITITYNLIKADREKTFRQCIESVHNQTYKNIEHIIIDGASSDGTLDLIKEYEDKGWIKSYSEPDKGIFDAMNKGIKKAKGEYINFLNTDDFFHDKNGVEMSVKKLIDDDADYSFSNVISFDEATKSSNLWIGDLNARFFGAFCCHQGMFVKKNVLEELDGFDLSTGIAADVDMMQKLAEQYKSTFIPQPFATYRTSGASQQNWARTRSDSAKVIYKNYAEGTDLTLHDCYLLWGFSFMKELSLNENFMLIQKMNSLNMIKSFVGALMQLNQNQEKEREEVFCILGIPFCKKKIDKKRNTYYLFGFIPLFKYKRI